MHKPKRKAEDGTRRIVEQKEDENWRPDAEVAKDRDAVLKRMLNTAPKTHAKIRRQRKGRS